VDELDEVESEEAGEEANERACKADNDELDNDGIIDGDDICEGS
jgi:hypothetical protein